MPPGFERVIHAAGHGGQGGLVQDVVRAGEDPHQGIKIRDVDLVQFQSHAGAQVGDVGR